MKKKYTVIIRAKVNGHPSVKGFSSYDSKNYNSKFLDALYSAVYVDYYKRHKRQLRNSDFIFTYELVYAHRVYPSGIVKKAPKGANRRMRREVLSRQEKVKEKYIDKDIVVKRREVEKMKKKEYVEVEKSEYEQFLDWKRSNNAVLEKKIRKKKKKVVKKKV
jgi:hypothetical protein